MKMQRIKCPQCEATLKVDNELDEYVCEYCGNRFLIDGLSKASLDARVKIKEFEHIERMADKSIAFDKFKMIFAWKNKITEEKSFWYAILGMLVVCFLLLGLCGVLANSQDRKLEKIVDEIMIDIENEEFSDAYVKAESLYWNDEWSDSGKKKWNATRKEIIKQIKKAEEQSRKEAKEREKEEKGSFFNWFN